MRRLIRIGTLTLLAFSLVACANQAKPTLIVDEPLVIGHQATPKGAQFASLWNPSRAEAFNGTGGGSSFNAAAPGAIGGTTSSTGQFTRLAVGATPPTLPTHDGDINAQSIGVGTTANGNAGQIVLPSGGQYNLANAGSITTSGNNMALVQNNGTTNILLTPLGVSIPSGVTLQSTGGAIPTVTCSGGSTGTSVTAGSTNNRGSFVSSSSASTNCTLTWSAAGTWAQAPFCHFFDAGASITPLAYSMGACGTSTCVVDFASTTSKTIGYMCL